MDQRSVILINVTKNLTVGTDIALADTCLRRLIGLVARRRLDVGCGLLIKPSSGVHTFGMLFAIDVVGFNKDMKTVKLWRRLPPFRVTSISLKVSSIVELPAGTIDKCRIELGDQFECRIRVPSV
jgi:hypothetical protein